MSKSANLAGNAGVNFGSRRKIETDLFRYVTEAIKLMNGAVKYIVYYHMKMPSHSF